MSVFNAFDKDTNEILLFFANASKLEVENNILHNGYKKHIDPEIVLALLGKEESESIDDKIEPENDSHTFGEISTAEKRIALYNYCNTLKCRDCQLGYPEICRNPYTFVECIDGKFTISDEDINRMYEKITSEEDFDV